MFFNFLGCYQLTLSHNFVKWSINNHHQHQSPLFYFTVWYSISILFDLSTENEMAGQDKTRGCLHIHNPIYLPWPKTISRWVSKSTSTERRHHRGPLVEDRNWKRTPYFHQRLVLPWANRSVQSFSGLPPHINPWQSHPHSPEGYKSRNLWAIHLKPIRDGDTTLDKEGDSAFKTPTSGGEIPEDILYTHYFSEIYFFILITLIKIILCY